MSRVTPDGTAETNPSRAAKFSGANGDREIFIFPGQLTTSRIGNLTRLTTRTHPVDCSAMCDENTYIYSYLLGRWNGSSYDKYLGLLLVD